MKPAASQMTVLLRNRIAPASPCRALARLATCALAAAALLCLPSTSIAANDKTPAEESTEIASLRKKAEQGDAEAQYNLAGMHANGKGVPKDEAGAAAWFRKAAEQGHARAQYTLGWMYQEGRGVAKDEAGAAIWFRKAADQGDVQPQYKLALMYESGRGVAQDDIEALAWWYLINGAHGLSPDAAAAVAYKISEIERNLLPRQLMLAQQRARELYASIGANGKASAPKTPDGEPMRVTSLRKLAEEGNSEAQLQLGARYEIGDGVARDEAQAAAWYRKAADQGYDVAQYNLAAMYADGRGVAKDEAEAAAWYLKAANKGYPQAQHSLGGLYADGRGVAKDPVEALAWWYQARDRAAYQMSREETASVARKISEAEKNLAPEKKALARQRSAELSKNIHAPVVKVRPRDNKPRTSGHR